MTWAKLMIVLPLSALLSACSVEVGRAGTVLLLVLLPAVLVFALLWGLRMRNRPDSRKDRRNYPDFDDRD